MLRRYVTFPEVRAKMANDLITHHKGEIGKLAAVRRDALRELKGENHTVAEIAELVGIAEPQVYAQLKKSIEKLPEPRTRRPLADLLDELLTIIRQSRNVEAGKTPSIPLGPVGSRILAEDLEEAVDHLTDMARQIQDFDMDAMLASGSANLNQDAR
jgi:hypothetical protein